MHTTVTILDDVCENRKQLFAYLLPTVRRKVEDQDGKEGYAHARDDQIDSVKKRLAPKKE